jgi:hypothetical protein
MITSSQSMKRRTPMPKLRSQPNACFAPYGHRLCGSTLVTLNSPFMLRQRELALDSELLTMKGDKVLIHPCCLIVDRPT